MKNLLLKLLASKETIRMRTKIIFWAVIVSSIVSETSTTLKGGIDAVCEGPVSYRQSRTLTFREEGLIRIQTKFRTEYYTAWVVKQKCCPGYENINGTCSPRCLSPCKNGYCAQPNTCVCNDGYQQYQQGNTSICEAICEEPCMLTTAKVSTFFEISRMTRSVESHNITEAPKHFCNDGYQNGTNQTCDPIYKKPCSNGIFVAPDNCTCNSGFVQNSTTMACDHFCKDGCDNGNCVGPNVCECLDGYVESIGAAANGTRCEPHCDDSCNNGVCTAPNICTCNPGFRRNLTTKNCEPVCTEPCVNGVCESSETCACLKGYVKSATNSSMCEAVCENCINGFCKTPEECVCKEGFVRDKMDNKTCVASCKPECMNGVCYFGQGGDSCGEPRLCFVRNSLQGVFVEAERNLSKPGVNNTVTEKPGINLQLSACRPECLTQLGSTHVNSTQNTTDGIYQFISINSSCNIAADDSYSSNKYRTVIGVVLGILLFGMIVCAAYYLTRRMRMTNSLNRRESMQCLYTDYMELDSNEGEDQAL